LERRVLPPEVWQADRLTLWRERALFTMLLVAVVLGPMALVPSLVLAWAEERWLVVAMDLASYTTAVLVLATTRLLPLTVRGTGGCLVLYLLGVGLLTALGPLGAGYIWLFGASVLAGALMGFGAAMASLAANAAALAAVGLMIHYGRAEWVAMVPGALEKWLVTASNFLLLNTLVASTIAVMLASLRRALMQEQEASAHLARSERRFRALAENAPDVIFTLDSHGRLDYANPALERLLGHDPDEVAGRSLWELAAGGEKGAMHRAFRQVMENAATVQGVEEELTHADGRRLGFVLSGAPRLGRDGRPAGMVGMLKDVTAERELQNQLMHAQKMEALGVMAGGIAHDFNNILGAIVGYGELGLDAGRQGRPAVNELEQVLGAAERARGLVRRILTFSRKVEPKREPVEVGELVSETAKLVGRTLPKMISLELKLASGLGPALADAGQIEQVLMNLAANARDAMPSGGRLVMETSAARLDQEYCRLHPGARPGDYLVIAVSDNGQGMDRETLTRMFEPFYTTKEPGRGTGLGLAMAFGILKNHGGYIMAYSEPDQGSTLKLYLPAAEEKALDQAPRAETRLPLGRGETILLVDDEASIREIGRRILTEAGYRVRLAASGEEALKLVQRRPGEADLVVLDISMPGMGGIACLERLRELRPDIKVIVASGYTRHAPLGELGEKAQLFVDKPFTRQEMLAGVRQVLDGEEPAAPALA